MQRLLLFCVESDNRSRSDWFYIKEVIDHFFERNAEVSAKTIFMCGKGNYKSFSVRRQISQVKKSALTNTEVKVIYCIDTDRLEADANCQSDFQEIEEYCSKTGSKLIWFCRDIEEVFIGKSIPKSEKTDRAKRFKIDSGIDEIVKNKLRCSRYRKGTSNILLVLEDYLSYRK